MKTKVPLILASGSPRRQRLLLDLGLQFEVVVREVDETPPSGMSPVALAEYLAALKGAACADLVQSHIVISADTVVALDDQLLAKPADRAEAIAMLQALSGRENQVISGVCIQHGGQRQIFHDVTRVTFRALEPWEIAHYVDHFRPYDKAGAYGIQEWIGMVGIDRIDGDYYNVVGLPVGRVWGALKAWRLAE
jgi:septum formation protein